MANHPISLEGYRPISCYNLLYKAISKSVANKLSKVVNSMVSFNQNVFILGRQIHENLIFAHELIRGYNRKNMSKKCAIKFDSKELMMM